MMTRYDLRLPSGESGFYICRAGGCYFLPRGGHTLPSLPASPPAQAHSSFVSSPSKTYWWWPPRDEKRSPFLVSLEAKPDWLVWHVSVQIVPEILGFNKVTTHEINQVY